MRENDASVVVINDSKVMLQIVASLTDDSRGVIYCRNMFIVQATEHFKNWRFYMSLYFYLWLQLVLRYSHFSIFSASLTMEHHII
jgi:hypothetical protein